VNIYEHQKYEHQKYEYQKRVALLLEYDGSFYAGWQRQVNEDTVQSVIETALMKIIGVECTLIGSGRTDAGVHGRGQVAHVNIPDSCRIPEEKFSRALNANLPHSIRIRAAKFIDYTFHARFDAMRREYRYTILREYSVFRNRYAWHVHAPFDADLLNTAAEVFVGKHNFTTFSKHNPDTSNYVCSVEQASWHEMERGVWQFTIAADRFVYRMVRAVVGATLDVASHKRSILDISAALAAENRALSSPLAPSQGLILWRVSYPNDPFKDEHIRDIEQKMSILG
jgi:tRNA pseudouridine38-40 synthase